MKLSKSALLLLVLLLLLFLVPERALLPIRSGTLMAFARRGGGGEEPLELKVRALEEEVERLRAERGQQARGGRAALGAPVVYRGPTSWNSTLWIGVGEVDNVAKGSSVVLGKALVGVVDYVGKRRSRVCLITDSRLHPSVQVASSEERAAALLSHLAIVEEALPVDSPLRENLELLKNHFGTTESNSSKGGKGELCGASHPLWRSKQRALEGIGFEGEGVALGDLLVTTGLDGVFPAGLEVGHVVEVKRIHQGSPTYSLKALPAMGELSGATRLFVLPPLP
ncbi:MAG: rod shape-determining protein MreC [Parachlamydiales bacterium]